MTTKEYDTDPSTPSARRPNKMRSTSPPPPADTDPGLAPPPVETDPPSVPLGIRVPSNRPAPITADSSDAMLPVGLASNDDAQKGPKKDSVEILLDGMAELRLDRSRTTPQTAGQASASYHAEHEVRVSERPLPMADEPKVLLEQPPTVTVRLARGASLRPGEADPTWIRPQQTLRRVLVALAAGLAVVTAIFVWLQASSRSAERVREGAAKPEQASQPVVASPPVVPASTPGASSPEAPAAVIAAPGAAAPGVAAEGTATEAALAGSAAEGRAAGKTPAGHGSGAPSAHTNDGHGNTAGHRTKASPGTAANDLGEFKTTY
jgi:hypothetical protein